jgi:hypothetical protein
MARSGPEVADVFRRYGSAYRAQHDAQLSTAQRRLMTAIELCRTAALGGHVEQCDQCGHQRISYCSCRNRHCPKCQSLARAQWLDDRRAELLATQYFHVVLTLPEAIANIAYQNKAVVYGILFRTASETLQTIAADPKHLGAEIGFFAVLHTWGQNLLWYPRPQYPERGSCSGPLPPSSASRCYLADPSQTEARRWGGLCHGPSREATEDSRLDAVGGVGRGQDMATTALG